VPLRRDLAYACYLSGDIKKAKEIIDPVVASDFADEQSFQVAGAIERVLGSTAKARRVLNKGLDKFPHSGLLFYSKGNLYNRDKSTSAALKTWLAGIQADPAFASNYYAAAQSFFGDHNYVWALLYGEIFLNLDADPSRGLEIKKMMLGAYQGILSPSEQDKLPEFHAGGSSAAEQNNNFRAIFRQLILENASVIRKELNAETLTMLRTRFIMDWNARYAASRPFTLFSYQEKLLQAGHFDAYNQWIFGAAGNSQAFVLWIKNNAEHFSGFEKWRKNNPLQPAHFDPKP
jgi:tetratricopeptide (TPR) repeat protein